METQSVSSITSTPISQSGTQGGILNQEDFLEIMIAELANQDPFEPLDNREFLGQLTQMQNLEASTQMTESLAQLSESLQSMTFGQQLASASTLIGQMVSGQDVNGLEVIGIVTSFEVNGGRSVLKLSGVQGIGEQAGSSTVPTVTSMELQGVREVRGPVLVEITEDEADLPNDQSDSTQDPSGGSDGP